MVAKVKTIRFTLFKQIGPVTNKPWKIGIVRDQPPYHVILENVAFATEDEARLDIERRENHVDRLKKR